MLILVSLLAAVIVAWILLGPHILPPATAPSPSAVGLEGRWTRTPDNPLATTLAFAGPTYRLDGALRHIGAGMASREDGDLVLGGDAACPQGRGRYAVELGDVDRYGLLPHDRAQTMELTLIDDACGSRAATLVGAVWTLRASGRPAVYGICDPPNEEAAVTGHWPEPSGCSKG